METLNINNPFHKLINKIWQLNLLNFKKALDKFLI